MASPRRPSAARQEDSVPSSLPNAIPSVPYSDHNFTLQTVMELQKATGELRASVQALQRSIEDQCKATERQIDRVIADMKTGFTNVGNESRELQGKLSGITHKIYAAGVVLTICLVIGGWVINSAWQMISAVATPAIQEALHKTAGTPAAAPSPAAPARTKQ